MRTLAFGKYAALTLMVSVISLLSSCRNNDFDFEAAHGNLSESDVAYNDKFTELIGDIDPNHTWSTAQQSGVKVSIDIPGEHLLRIYTADPLTSTAFLLARYENIEGGTTHDLKFDIPASKTSFCAVLDSAEYRISKIVELDSNGFASFIMSDEDKSTTRATRAAPSRDYSSCYTFQGDGDGSYKNGCPDGVLELSAYNGDTSTRKAYKVGSSTTEINCWNGGCDIYFTNSEYTISKFYIGANTNIYLLPGANVTFTMNDGLNNNQSNVVMSIAPNAKITVNKNISHGFKLYNQGTIKCENFELYATGYTYNAGTINTGLTKVANYNSEFVNAGTLTCSGLNVEGTGKFQNTGTVVDSGTTLVNSNYCTWRNEGSYTTNSFTYNAGSTDVINNCKLKVNNLFEILLADSYYNPTYFDNNGSIDTKDFKMGIGYLLMGSKAVLKATGDAIMNITKAHYGIYGIGNDYAVFTAPEIKKNAENQGYCATYGGKLYVATPKHFAQGKSGDYPYYQIEGSAKLVQNAPAITSGGCSSGYTPSGTSSSAPDFGGGTGNTENSSSSINTSTSTTVDNPMHWIIACEDLPGETSDFDYNDIVFAVYHVGNTKTFQIKPLAAGGTLRAEILYRESANDFWNTASVNVDGNELSEIHQWITKNPSAPHTTMLNTDKGADVTKIINNIPVFTAEFANEVSMDNFADYFAVRVYQNNSSEETIIKSDVVENIPSTNSYKTAPRLICINSDDPTWQWMAERQPLYYHYTDFSNWASDKTAYTSWYQQIGSQEKQEFTIRWANTSNSNSGNNNSGNGNAEGSSTQQPTESNPIEEPETKNYVIYFWGNPVENNKREIGCNWTVDLSVKEISPDGIIDVTNDFTFKYNSTALYLNGNTAVACNTVEGTTSHVFEKAEGYANDITSNNETNATFKVISKKVITYPSTTDKQVNIWAEKKSNSSISTNPIILTIKGQDGRDDEVYYEGVNWSFSGMVDGHQKNGDYLGRGQSNNEFNTLSQNYDTNTKGVVKAIQDNSGKTIEWNVNVIPHILTGTTTLCDYEFSLKDNSTHNVKNVGDFTWHKVNPGSEIEVLYTLHDNGNGTKCSLRLSTTWCQDFVSFGEEAQRKQETYTFRYTLTQEILDKLQEQGFSVRGDGTVKKVYLINKPR